MSPVSTVPPEPRDDSDDGDDAFFAELRHRARGDDELFALVPDSCFAAGLDAIREGMQWTTRTFERRLPAAAGAGRRTVTTTFDENGIETRYEETPTGRLEVAVRSHRSEADVSLVCFRWSGLRDDGRVAGATMVTPLYGGSSGRVARYDLGRVSGLREVKVSASIPVEAEVATAAEVDAVFAATPYGVSIAAWRSYLAQKPESPLAPLARPHLERYS